MNQSHFIKTLKENYGVSFDELWQSSVGHKSESDVNRAYDDAVETAFWQSHSQMYDKIPSLIDYAPETLLKLVEIMGCGRTAIEFGCGTGKFTLPMSKHCKSITGVDFSKDMLTKLNDKMIQQAVNNIDLFHGKFEDVTLDKVDCVYGVNANYRMLGIKDALLKMKSLAKEKVILVWTMQRNIYDALLNQSPVKGIQRGQEYIHLINILYDLGIDPSMEIMTVTKPIEIECLEDHYVALKDLAVTYNISYESLKASFEQAIVKDNGDLYYNCRLKVAFIYFECSE